MYLTEVWVENALVRNKYNLHKVLWRLFPEKMERSFLFLFEKDILNQGFRILLQSSEKPQYENTSMSGIQILRESKEISGLQFSHGQLLKFKLVANPTKKIKDSDCSERSIRVPLITFESQQEWLERKFLGIARLIETRIEPVEPIFFSKKDMHGKIQPMKYFGALEVINPVVFKELMINGIGPAKAFGCGLLQVARL